MKTIVSQSERISESLETENSAVEENYIKKKIHGHSETTIIIFSSLWIFSCPFTQLTFIDAIPHLCYLLLYLFSICTENVR